MVRRVFIGDIQGCREELERLLESLRYDPAADQLEPVGDFVNRGPDSLGVLRLMRSLGAGGVLGNHDVNLLRTAAGLRRKRQTDTLDAVLEASDRQELLAWLAERPLVRAWPDVLLVHAGLKPHWKDPARTLAGKDPLALDEDGDFATRVRYSTPQGVQAKDDWPPPAPPFAPWHEHWLAASADPRTVVFGHWSRQGLVLKERLRGLDTGCVWGKQLTAWIPEEDRIVQVRAGRAYAPYD